MSDYYAVPIQTTHLIIGKNVFSSNQNLTPRRMFRKQGGESLEVTPNRECPGWPGRVRAVTLLLVASALLAGVAASCAAPQPDPRSDAQPATTSEVQPVPGSDSCLLYTSDAADDLTRVDLGGRR